MSKRTPFDRIPSGNDELVITLDDRERIDIRLWTNSGDVRLASANGLAIHRKLILALIDALECAKRQEAA